MRMAVVEVPLDRSFRSWVGHEYIVAYQLDLLPARVSVANAVTCRLVMPFLNV